MDYKKPFEIVSGMVQASLDKAALNTKDLLVRGMLSGALLGFGTTLAIAATVQTKLPIIGAIIFPAGFIIIVLLGLELVTGNFASMPMGNFAGVISWQQTFRNWILVFTGNLLGSLLYAALFWISITKMGTEGGGAIAAAIRKIAVAKTTGYAAIGSAGMVTVFTKAILCNWMVTLGVVMGMCSNSTQGKILAAWLPIFIFFAQGFEHAVVNMFVIPEGIFLGAEVTYKDWWVYNQIPVTFGNIAGGLIFTGLALYITYGSKPSKKVKEIIPHHTREAEEVN